MSGGCASTRSDVAGLAEPVVSAAQSAAFLGYLKSGGGLPSPADLGALGKIRLTQIIVTTGIHCLDRNASESYYSVAVGVHQNGKHWRQAFAFTMSPPATSLGEAVDIVSLFEGRKVTQYWSAIWEDDTYAGNVLAFRSRSNTLACEFAG